jgi:hypothetical protein
VIAEEKVGIRCHADIREVVQPTQEHANEHIELVDLEDVLLFLLSMQGGSTFDL